MATVLPEISVVFPQSAQRNAGKEVCHKVLDDSKSLEHCALYYPPTVLSSTLQAWGG